MATIDSLDIKISASFNTATNAISKFNSQLGSTATLLNQVGSSSGLKKIANAGKSFSSNLLTATSGLKGINTKINGIGSALKKAERPAQSFTGSILKAYGAVKFLQVGFGTLGKSISKSVGYIETLNYFDKAFEQVAKNADLSAWQDLGYESAEAYADSFGERAEQLTSKMTGFNVDASGMLNATGMPGLGLDPEKLMNYQAMFAQMSNSMGVSSETALKLSDALTMIGADLASVRNMDFDKVWTDMASGLVGMSRTLDKYGANIRNVNLQQKLTELGINANVSALNQNDKALLRTIILLDSTRYAWGDLAETINTPANQLRLLESNFNSLARTIGNIFLPIVAKVLPYINGLVIALNRFFSWIGKIMGIKLSGLGGSKGAGGLANNFGAAADSAEDMSDAIGGATKNAKKLNRFVASWHEVTNMSSNDSGGSGSGTGGSGGGVGGLLDDAFSDAFGEYQKVWDEAFANMENRANEIADKIGNFFTNLFKPLRESWDTEGSYVMEAWGYALRETGKLAFDVGKDLMSVWQQPETVKIFEDIFHIVGDIGATTGNLVSNFRNAWNECGTGRSILENIRDILGAIVSNVRHAADTTVEWSAALDFSPALSKIEQWTESLVPVFDSLSGVITDFYENVLLPLGKWTLEEGLPDLLQVFIDFNNKVDWVALRDSLSGLWEHLEPFAETVGEGLVLFVDRISDALAGFVNSDSFDSFLTSVGNWMDNVSAEDVADGITGLAVSVLTLKAAISGFGALSEVVTVVSTLSAAFFMMNEAVSGVSALISSVAGPVAEMFALWTGGAGTLGESFMAVFGTGGVIGLSLAALVAGLGYVFATSEQVRESFGQAVAAIREGLQPAIQFATETLLPDLRAGWDRIVEVLTPLGEFLRDVFTSVWQDMINPALTYIGNTVLPRLSGAFESLWNNVLVPFGSFVADVLEPVIKILSDNLSILWENVVVPLADAVGSSLAKSFETICDVFETVVIPALGAQIDAFQFLWDELLSPIVDFLWDSFKPAFEDVFKAVGDIIEWFGTTFGGVADLINKTADAIGNLLGKAEKTEGIGYITSGRDLTNIAKPNLRRFSIQNDLEGIENAPELAKGGVLKRGQWGFLEGDGAEAVVPLEKNTGWIRSVAKEISNMIPTYQLSNRFNTNLVPADLIPLSIPASYNISPYSPPDIAADVQEQIDVQMATYMYEVRRQNELLEEQNALLERIYDKTGITEGEIFNATRKGVKSFQNRTKKNPWPVLA